MTSVSTSNSAHSSVEPKLRHSEEVEISRPLSDFRIARQLIDARFPDIAEQDREPIMRRIITHVDFLMAAYQDIHEVKGKRILDLA
jgi:hypothetical protein